MKNEWSLHPLAFTYWVKKEQFLLAQDTDPAWTMFAVERGRFAYRIGAHAGEAGFGDLVVCPPGIAFHRRALSPLTFHFIKFDWEVAPGPDESAALGGRWTVRDAERLLSTYRYMKEIGGAIRQEPALGRMKHMMEDLWRLMEIERSHAESAARYSSDAPAPDMVEARKWLLERAYQPLAMRELSDALGISPVQLTRRFRAAYRTTPTEFVTGLRLERACRLLEETTQPLDWIAQQCGYENGFYLSRVFTAKLGMTPSAHRRLHRV
ncbi:helix-turn-helix domain-containing protein [Cohnella rhizosphaerae]|uniref:AraC family transcriptional regulator n=1 Tax=Cohnella rhizosphaerae TaxID=1457232 RepID=A0A9X4QWB0_9BACL|nr:AraC family transcriptional regulator [Cohnella rhizosphaerae]MDG0813313.1 AraC family transcriptional regulator [Cohnella rhizosphaerae]